MANNETKGKSAAEADSKAPATPPEAKQHKGPPKPTKEESGFCVYLGPSIHAAILSGTVFSKNKADALKELEGILVDYPLIADLIVPGDALPESRIKVRTPGNLLHVKYAKLAASVNSKQGGQ